MKPYLLCATLLFAPLFAQETSPTASKVEKYPSRALSIPYASLEEAEKPNPWESSWCQKLSGTWKFAHTTDLTKTIADFAAPGFDDKTWKDMPVPSNWQMQDFTGLTMLSTTAKSRTLKSIGRYRHEFTVPDAWKSRKNLLYFGGVESAFTVWLNGKKLGFAEDACTAAEFDISSHVQEGKNLLAVEVYQFSGHIPDPTREAFHVSGIYRDVYLLSHDAIMVEDIHIKAGLSADHASGLFESTVMLKNSGTAAVDISAKINLTDREGRSIASPGATIKVPANQLTPLTLKTDPLPQIKAWSAETPYLYRAVLTLQDASGKTIATHRYEVGFDHSAFKDGTLRHNGQPIELKGVRRNEFHAQRGQALSEEDIKKELLTLKTAHFNAIWNDNRPADEVFLRLCDSLGFYVIEGANDIDLPENAADMAQERMRNLVMRDRNHASVIAWAGDTESLNAMVQPLDDTRPILGKSFYEKSFATMKDIAVRKVELLADQSEAPTPEVKQPDSSGTPGLQPPTPQVPAKPKTRSVILSGAAIDPQITDSYFGAKGILTNSGQPKPVFEEWKKRNQEISTRIPDVNGSPLSVVVRNMRFFRALSDVKGSWKLMKNGQAVASGDLDAGALGPQQEIAIPVTLSETKDPRAEYFFRVRFDLVEATAWHPAGMPIAWEEIPLLWGKRLPATLGASPKEAGFSENDNQIQLTAEEATASIDKKSGMLVSWKMKNQEMLLAPLALNFWRANSPSRSEAQRVWQKAGREAKVTSIQAAKENGMVVVKVALALAAGQSSANVTYRWNNFGKISIETELRLDPAMPDLPVIGYHTRVVQALANVRWYGKGPGETYPDRESSAWTTVHQNFAPQMFFRHVKPQECGSRSGIRWLELTNIAGGWSLRAESGDDQTMQVTCYPCGVDELDQAKNLSEMPKATYQEIHINHRQSAVDAAQESTKLAANAAYRWTFLLSSQNLPPSMPATAPGKLPAPKPPVK